MNRKHVILFQRIIPAYRVPIFRYLYEEVNVLVSHSKSPKFGKISSKLEYVDYPTISVGRVYFWNKETAVIQNVLKPLIIHKPDVVISPASLSYGTTWLLLLLKPFFKFKIILWGHGINNFELKSPLRGFRRRMAKWLFNRADAMILYSQNRKLILESIIKTPIHVASNTLDTRTLGTILKRLQKDGIAKVKKEVGFRKPFNIIYIGRLQPSKRIDLMLESFKLLSVHLDAALHIVGDGTEMTLVKKYQQKMNNIITYGAIYDENITSKLLYASDIMLMPGYVGLSVIHAFSFCVPLVTCKASEDNLVHGPEIEYLIDRKNGLLCEPNAQNISEAIIDLLSNEQRLQNMKEYALFTVKKRASVERFIEGFKYAIESCY